jgi:segregation and condensation protein B
VAAIRGVDPDAVLRTLQSRGYVDQVGRDPGPGQAVLWGTTPQLLERLGLGSVADLPPIADFVPGADVVEALEAGLRVEPVHLEDLDPADELSEGPADDRSGGLSSDPPGEGPSGDGA